jgi:hypothetical protein
LVIICPLLSHFSLDFPYRFWYNINKVGAFASRFNEVFMTTTQTLPTTLPVLTPRGVRIPLVGTICCHPALGFATVVSRTQRTVRIVLDDLDDADDVTLRNGDVISRAAWLSRVSDASLTSACIEIAGFEARLADREDALHGATAFVKETCARLEARVRDVNEMLVSIDAAERCGWEFDEFATFTPLRNIKKATAPKPVVVQPAVVEELEDDTRPDWLVAEMNACFGDKWIPNGERQA